MMFSSIGAALVATLLAIAMAALMEAGRRIGRRRRGRDVDASHAGTGAIDGAVFALLGLLVAFTFSGAAQRFEERRHLIVEEANDIGTAWLRIDTLSPEDQPPLRDLFRRYLDSRLTTYRLLPDLDAALGEMARSQALQAEIWALAVPAAQRATPPATIVLLPALNAMFDITTTRAAGMQMHPPMVIYLMLAGIALASAFLAGHGMAPARERSWLHIAAFSLIMASTVYVILDLEFPRLGFIRVDAMDVVLEDVRRGME